MLLLLAKLQTFLPLKRTLEFGKPRVPEVLVGQYGIVGRDSPVDSQALIQNAYAPVSFRVVELVAFVLEDSSLGQDGKAVGEALGNEELSMVVLRELHRDVLPVGVAAFADVHCNIQHGPTHTPHQLALGEGRTLEVQAAHNAVGGHGFVVLDEAYFLPEKGGNPGVEFPLGETFEEISAGILENFGLYDINP